MKEKSQSKGKPGIRVIDQWRVGDTTIVIGKDKHQIAIGHIDKKENVRWKRYIAR